MDAIKSANLALRFLLELAAVAALVYWEFTVGRGTIGKLLLGVGVPLLVVVIWAAFVSPKAAVAFSAPVTLLLGLVILGLAAAALAAAGQPTLAVVFGAVISINAVLMLVWKQ